MFAAVDVGMKKRSYAGRLCAGAFVSVCSGLRLLISAAEQSAVGAFIGGRCPLLKNT